MKYFKAWKKIVINDVWKMEIEDFEPVLKMQESYIQRVFNRIGFMNQVHHAVWHREYCEWMN